MLFLKFADYFFYTFFGGLTPDPRTKDWAVSNNFGFLAGALSAYLMSVWIGPKIMRHLKPFELKKTMVVYNTAMIIFNAYIVYLAGVGGWFTHYKFLCQQRGSIDDPLGDTMVLAQYYYLISKYLELLDTEFFILRKKERQVSFLDVYHHFVVLSMVWGSVRYLPDGHITFMTLVNSFIHVIMYSYYLLAGFGPSVQKYLWWKRYLTRMQLTQFFIVIAHSFWVLHPSCDYPKGMIGYMTFHVLVFVYLFTDFYNKNYTGVKDEMKKTGKKLDTMCHPAGMSQAVKQD